MTTSLHDRMAGSRPDGEGENMTGRMEGKAAIVTGAGSTPGGSGVGIGQAIATVFAREGGSVLLVDKDPARAENTLGTFGGLAGRGVVFEGDVTSRDDCAAMVAKATEEFGGLDVLVNNAAIDRHGPLTETSDEDYDAVLEINLKGSFLATAAAIPAMVERGGGSIVMIGSIAGIRDSGTPHPAYCASKAGQLGLMNNIAGEYGRKNIRANAVLPGIIASPMMEQSSGGGLSDDIRKRLNLLGRTGSSWDVANAVLFLCSDEGSYMTGHVMPVDGGATVGMAGGWTRADRG
jgi:NAD(P)-dependent dehydrogenase (short-subunit alcohol dehydrogenase family)